MQGLLFLQVWLVLDCGFVPKVVVISTLHICFLLAFPAFILGPELFRRLVPLPQYDFRQLITRNPHILADPGTTYAAFRNGTPQYFHMKQRPVDMDPHLGTWLSCPRPQNCLLHLFFCATLLSWQGWRRFLGAGVVMTPHYLLLLE